MKNTTSRSLPALLPLLLLLLANSKPAQAQSTTSDLQLLDRAFTPAPRQRLTARYSASQQNPNEVQALLSGLFLVYKAFVSSQDQNRCNFAPSCSEYGLEAVKKLGVIRGGLSTFDRLTRCNGINRNEYPIDPKTLRLSDPVRW